jgi:hypothetical protein
VEFHSFDFISCFEIYYRIWFFTTTNGLSNELSSYFKMSHTKWLIPIRAWSWIYKSSNLCTFLKKTNQFAPLKLVHRSNLVHGDVNPIQHYVIKFVSYLREVGGFLRVLLFPPPIKLTATIYIANSDVKHHCHNPPIFTFLPTWFTVCNIYTRRNNIAW